MGARILVLLAVLGLGGVESAVADEVFTVWHYESGALAESWNAAVKVFQAAHPRVKVVVTVKSFEEVRQTAESILESDQAPDVMELNKGNAYAGVFGARGLIRDLSAEAVRRGWDKLLPPSLQTTARYNARGIMGGGSWFGVSPYGEFLLLYYNKDLFRFFGRPVPTTLADLEATMAVFRKAGVVPLALGAANFPSQHLLYELYLSRASRSQLQDYQTYRNPVDFRGPEWTFAATTLARWASAGYLGPRPLAVDDAGQLAEFRAGRSALLLMGTWGFSGLQSAPLSFDWGTFVFPGNRLHPGSGGNLWVVPTKAKHPDWALEFIDLTLRKDIQTLLANAGGLAINPDPSTVTNDRARVLMRDFQSLLANDALAYYADWPAQGFYESLLSGTQDLIRGLPPSDVLDGLGLAYRANRGRP